MRNSFRNVFQSYRNLFYAVKNMFSRREKVVTKSVETKKSSNQAEESRRIRNDFYVIGRDMEVAINKYESTR
ncbi:hypothetical protein [Listeria booriae]|uniref:hypothetical protein n=1 Tax=Listeria booriae TaxID=1552123 RepID=UPI0016236905|nr:hypothetical protein [Listeria booriae]MBC1891385.1 hypothetical protein [Listeria booriae]